MPRTIETGDAGVSAYGYRGSFGLNRFGSSGNMTLTEEEVVDLTWPMATRTYDRVRKSDSKVSSSMRAMFAPILSADWRINPRNASDTVTRTIAEDLGLPILGEDDQPPNRTRDRFDWIYYLRHCLLSRVYGFMPFEVNYRTDINGLFRIRKIAPRMPHTLTWDGVQVADDGGLIGIEQNTRRHGPRPIGINSLVMHVHDREGYDWYGNSILRPIYRDWVLKDHYHRIAAILMSRNGAGVPIFTDPSKDEVDNPKAEAEAGQKLAESYRVGESAGGRIPHTAKLTLQGVEGDLPDVLAFIRYHDEQIAGNVLEMFSSLPSAPNGSRALGSTLLDFFVRSLNSHADDTATITTNHVIEDHVDANWGPDEPAPAVECVEIGAEQQLTAMAIANLIRTGAITKDRGLENYLRRFYRLPALTAPDEPAPEPDPDEDEPAEAELVDA